MPTPLSSAFGATLERARLDLSDTPSSALPEIPNKKGKSNWVEKAGGLPDFIDRVAKHIQASNPAYSTSRVIASAVSQVKKMAAKGNAKAVAAVAAWEKMKASTKADLSAIGPLPGEVERLVLCHGSVLTESDAEAVERLALARTPLGDGFGLALSAARLDLAVISFDPSAHPRDYKGQFKKTLESLKSGESVKLPDGTTVKRIDRMPLAKYKDSNEKIEPSFYARRPGDERGRAFSQGDAGKVAEEALKESVSAGPKGELPDEIPTTHDAVDPRASRRMANGMLPRRKSVGQAEAARRLKKK